METIQDSVHAVLSPVKQASCCELSRRSGPRENVPSLRFFEKVSWRFGGLVIRLVGDYFSPERDLRCIIDTLQGEQARDLSIGLVIFLIKSV